MTSEAQMNSTIARKPAECRGLTFIVSAHDDPAELQVCLASLRLQTVQGKIIVCDNSERWSNEIHLLAQQGQIIYWRGQPSDGCYTSANKLIFSRPTEEFLCFPSSDSYYVPGFAEIMLRTASENDLDFVYCDCIYDPRLNGGRNYSLLYTMPKIGSIDKTCFIVRSTIFSAAGGFPDHLHDYRDGALAEMLVHKLKVRHMKAPGVLVFHN